MANFEILREQLLALEQVNGITPVEILDLPDSLHAAVRKMLKRALPLTELADEIGLPPEQARLIGDILVDKGYLLTEEQPDEGGIRYKVYFARMHARHIPIDL